MASGLSNNTDTLDAELARLLCDDDAPSCSLAPPPPTPPPPPIPPPGSVCDLERRLRKLERTVEAMQLEREDRVELELKTFQDLAEERLRVAAIEAAESVRAHLLQEI